MNEILARARRLPRPLVDGTLTNCQVQVVGGRIELSEPQRQVFERRWSALRRRGRWLAAATVSAGVAVATRGVWRGVSSLISAFAGLGALDGLAQDVGRGRGHVFATVDAIRSEVDLRIGAEWRITAELHEVHGFVVVEESEASVAHLAVVLGRRPALFPWMGTHHREAALALGWLLGYLIDRPAWEVEGSFPFDIEILKHAVPIATPKSRA